MKDRLRSAPVIAPHAALAALVLTLAVAFVGCTSQNSNSDRTAGAAAQVGGAPAAGRHRMAEALSGLGLSKAQKGRIREIMSVTRKENADADPSTRRANFKEAFAKIDTVLSPDQRAKLHAKLAQMREERGETAPSQS